MRVFFIIGLALVALPGFAHAGVAGHRPIAGSAKVNGVARGNVHALAVFSRFQEEKGSGTEVPEFAQEIFDTERVGSLAHFYAEMSRGQFQLTGECLSFWYAATRPVNAYQPPEGNFGDFVRDILSQVDAEIDLGLYDNDGPDGQPNSGDDDGYVDFLFVVTRSAPPDFIYDEATGIAALGLGEDFASDDIASGGGVVRVRADGHRQGVGGVLQQGHTFEVAVGSMAHEFGHFLGLPDLYDLAYDEEDESGPEEDSAGIGYWGIMGHGNRGWNERGGPNPFCAWSLRRLGWLGIDNEQLVVMGEDLDEVVFEDVNAGGKVYQLPIGEGSEYFLVEYRRRGNSYYERNLPAEGLLIWRIDERRVNNNDERALKVDLVCADGLYIDAGYPQGTQALAVGGRDNLDFWAHDEPYRALHAGNLGDATDLFDGVQFTDFWAVSNPSAPIGVSVTRIHPRGQTMVADLKLNDRRRAGFVAGEEIWADTVEVLGDVIVMAGGRLNIRSGTIVLLGEDRLQRGGDPERVELVVQGELVADGFGDRPVVFTSAATEPNPGDWQGIVVHSLGSVILRQVLIEYAVEGLASQLLEGEGSHLRPVTLLDVVIRHSRGDGLRLAGVAEPVTLEGLQVHDAGGMGVRIEGRGLTRITLAHLSGNREGGLERIGGFLECRESRLVNNGVGVDGAANLALGVNVFGEVASNTFSGGIGIRCVQTQEIVITDNLLSNMDVGLVAFSARPRISNNQFYRNRLVFQVLGTAVPTRLDLNIVQKADQLLDNRSERTVRAINNWWGRTDEEWIAARMSGPVDWRPFLNFDPRFEVGFSLAQNFPNPFNGSTMIRYTVGINEPVVTGRARTVLEVRNIAGGLVRRLVDEPAAPGLYETVWDGRNEGGKPVASGVYYYQLQVGPIFQWKRLLFLK